MSQTAHALRIPLHVRRCDHAPSTCTERPTDHQPQSSLQAMWHIGLQFPPPLWPMKQSRTARGECETLTSEMHSAFPKDVQGEPRAAAFWRWRAVTGRRRQRACTRSTRDGAGRRDETSDKVTRACIAMSVRAFCAPIVLRVAWLGNPEQPHLPSTVFSRRRPCR